MTKGGDCISCERYFGANVQQTECIQCDPKEFEIIKEDGTCEPCPLGDICGQMNPGPLKHTCSCGSCPSDEYYLDVLLNKCVVCDEYFHAGPDGTNCTRCMDPTSLEIVNTGGECEQCPAGTHPAPLLENCDAAEGEICFPTKCIKDPTCPPWTIYDKDGYCVIECPAHQVPNADNTVCEIGACDPMPKLHIWDPTPANRGQCIPCDDYMIPNDDNTECIAFP